MEIVTIRKWQPGIEPPAPIPEAIPPAPLPLRQPPEREPPHLIINYPDEAVALLLPGTTTIDAKQRRVSRPDGTEETFYAARQIETCQSFLLHTDQPINIRLTRMGTPLYTSTIFQGWTRMTDAPEFTNIEIETLPDQRTVFHITMSEDPDGVPEFMTDLRITPAVQLGYNAAGDLVWIRKDFDEIPHYRAITDPDVADRDVDRWVEYDTWSVLQP